MHIRREPAALWQLLAQIIEEVGKVHGAQDASSRLRTTNTLKSSENNQNTKSQASRWGRT